MTNLLDVDTPPIALPSVFALPPLRRRLRQALDGGKRRLRLLELLPLDPLATLRCLRVAHSPVQRAGDGRALSFAQLREILGTPNLERAVDTPLRSLPGTAPPSLGILDLWRHAVATAIAARDLAKSHWALDPEVAYLLGLLHDLPQWIELLSGTNEVRGATEWRHALRHWHLPPPVLSLASDLVGLRGRRVVDPSLSPAHLIVTAEGLAKAAGFRHLQGESSSGLPAALSEKDLAAASALQQKVRDALAPFGLDVIEQIGPGASGDELARLGTQVSHDEPIEMVLRLLDAGEASQYRTIVTATTAAGIRYLGFDRVFLLRWQERMNRAWLRAKADLTPHALQPQHFTPTQDEVVLFRRLISGRESRIIRPRQEPPYGMLHLLGSDEALIVPITHQFSSRSFLVLDRALSGQPIRLEEDAVPARTLAGTAAVLIENQLLRRRRLRAERFSLTDPLTRLANRGVGIAFLGTQLAAQERSGAPMIVLMADLDNFKKLNDTHGHVAGDHALRRTAEVLRRTLRRSDLICRYGGEEFMIVLPGTGMEEAAVLATRLFTAVEECGRAIGLPLTVSLGIAQPLIGEPLETVLARADRALYASKERGRNRFSIDGD